MAERHSVTREEVEGVLEALAKAGRHLVSAQPGVSWRLKADGTFLTDLDLEIQRTMTAALGKIFPDCGLIGEEDHGAMEFARLAKPRLILDPIDGTAAYARGFNFFNISLALVDAGGEPLASFVHLPARNTWYVGAVEKSRWVSYAVEIAGRRVKAKPVERRRAKVRAWRIEDSYVYVSSNAHNRLEMSGFEGKVRALGPSSSHLVMLLDETPDPGAVILTQYKIWDAVAGLALAKAAGLEIRDLRKPGQECALAGLVNRLLGPAGEPPLVVGPAGMVGAIVRSVRCRKGQR